MLTYLMLLNHYYFYCSLWPSFRRCVKSREPIKSREAISIDED